MILSLGRENYKSFKFLENKESIVVFYENLIPPDALPALKRKKNLPGLITALFYLTGFVFSDKFSKKENNCCSRVYIDVKTGTVSIVGALVENHNLSENKDTIILYEKVGLLQQRLYNKIMIKPKLSHLCSHCPQKVLDLKKIGAGSYANVYKTNVELFCGKDLKIAIKISKIKPEAVLNPFSTTNISWREIYILQKIIGPILEEKMCPNLPLLYDAFFCKKCELDLQKEKMSLPCAITAVEFANGDLKSFLNKQRTEIEITSILFQIMAGLHAIQLYGQLVNFDIKKENILIYNVKPGGYWRYVIHDQEFFVPNTGILCILNDFGVSRSYSPSFLLCKCEEDKEYKLGTRPVLLNEGHFLPIKFQKGNGEFFIDRKTEAITPETVIENSEIINILESRELSTNPNEKDFFLFSEIIPPMEFYNDLQDVLRTFTGGKRTTQKGNHGAYKYLSREFIKKLEKYKGPIESFVKGADISKVLPEHVLASSFILDFFQEYKSLPKNGKILESYLLS